jgi:uncharacterized membrane protein YkoI
MRHQNAPRERWSCAERLESRRLLSGDGADAGEGSEVEEMPSLVAVPSVEVIELTPADEEEEEEREIDLDELPAAVLEALEAAYPGARILEAEMEEEDGETEYDVSAMHEGRTLEVGLTSSGEVIEVSQVLEEEDLPQQVIEWIEANFAGAELLEIELVSEDGFTSYELQIAPSGEAALEATIRVTTPPADPGDDPPAAPVAAQAHAPEAGAGASNSHGEAPSVPDVKADEHPQAQEAAAPPATEPVALDVPLDAAVAGAQRETPAEAAPEAADAARQDTAEHSPQMMPELAMLVGVTASELADLDEELGLLLGEIQKLAHTLEASGPAGNAGLALALILILIAGAQVLRPDPAPRSAQGLALMKAHGDWSWSSWSATTMRR